MLFKMVFIPEFGGACEYVSYHDSLDSAVTALNEVANYTLVLQAASLMPDYISTGLLFKGRPGE